MTDRVSRSGDSPVVLALPLFNDWNALGMLLPRLDEALAAENLQAAVVVIDDGSTDHPPRGFAQQPFATLTSVTVLRLRRNLGHQRAIAVGLAYIEHEVPCEAVVLMDADGEDAPADVPRLLDRFRRERRAVIVFAERQRRAETLLFRVFYQAYRLLHRALTGRGVRVGNFSVIPRERLGALVVVSELWTHYAAAAFRSKQPFVTVPTSRAARLDGRSRMDFVSLVVHGMAAISVYSDLVFVRLFMSACALALGASLGLAALVGVRLFTGAAIPDWAAFSSGLLLLLLIQAVMFVGALTFLGLGGQQHAPFVPARDFAVYIESVRVVEPVRACAVPPTIDSP